jgi:hypothetical protein
MVCPSSTSHPLKALTETDGGVDILARVNGEEICRSDAVYGVYDAVKKVNGESWVTIKNMTICNDHAVKFKKSDTVVVETNYDLGLHPRYVLDSLIQLEDSANFSIVASSIMEAWESSWAHSPMLGLRR